MAARALAGVGVAVAAREILQEEGTPTRVVSAPCLEWFAQQDAARTRQDEGTDLETIIAELSP